MAQKAIECAGACYNIPMPNSRNKVALWINNASMVVAFLLAPLAWYVAAIHGRPAQELRPGAAPVAWYVAAMHGRPLRHSEHDLDPTVVFVFKGEGGKYYVLSDGSILVATSTAAGKSNSEWTHCT